MTRTVASNTGTAFPLIGLGVMQIPDADVPAAMRTAADIGYRGFDTAPVYGNEKGVGEGIRACGLARADIAVTTKLWNGRQGYDEALRAFDSSMERMGLDYLDLYLIHWPVPSRNLYVDSWKALVRLRDEGRVRAIGVSNFEPDHLERIIGETGVVPAINQVELHPAFQQRALRAVHDRLGIITQAWSPLGRGETLKDPRVTAIADRLGVSTARVVLAWLTRQNIAVIPKASSAAHMQDNLQCLDLTLDDAAVAALEALDDPNGRTGPDPNSFDVTELRGA